MKEIKAFIHRNRIADVLHTLKHSGLCSDNCNISVVDVKGMLVAIDNSEQNYSLELGGSIITEVKLELVVEDHETDAIIQIIREQARTGQASAGWVFVNEIQEAYKIE
ncbi:MAG TPA: P-II family nitrogen regulator [Gammaproteobacteria bacterium]|nr:P-II family nitrogen regulator [Gammaproteobacteria bacterium]